MGINNDILKLNIRIVNVGKIALILLLIGFTRPLLAQLAPVSSKPTTPPANITFADSLFLGKSDDGKYYIWHTVRQGQTLYRIAVFYHTTMAEIRLLNNLQNDNLSVGAKVKIPTNPKYIYRTFKTGKSKYIKLYYKVQAGETLYKVAKRMLDLPVDTIVNRNNLKSATVSMGQTLHIGWYNPDGPLTSMADSLLKYGKGVKTEDGVYTMVGYANEVLKQKYDNEKLGKTEVFEQGAAAWRKDDRLTSKTSFFVLHNKAKPGSIVKLFNPRRARIVYAKVMGTIPPNNPQYANSVVVLSPPAAKALGGVDAKFFVKLWYLE